MRHGCGGATGCFGCFFFFFSRPRSWPLGIGFLLESHTFSRDQVHYGRTGCSEAGNCRISRALRSSTTTSAPASSSAGRATTTSARTSPSCCGTSRAGRRSRSSISAADRGAISRPGAATCRRRGSPNSAITTARADCRASSSRGSRAHGARAVQSSPRHGHGAGDESRRGQAGSGTDRAGRRHRRAARVQVALCARFRRDQPSARARDLRAADRARPGIRCADHGPSLLARGTRRVGRRDPRCHPLHPRAGDHGRHRLGGERGHADLSRRAEGAAGLPAEHALHDPSARRRRGRAGDRHRHPGEGNPAHARAHRARDREADRQDLRESAGRHGARLLDERRGSGRVRHRLADHRELERAFLKVPQFHCAGALLCLALLAAACATQKPDSGRKFEIGIVGDRPYTAADEARMPALIRDVNRADLAFVLRVGDMQADGAGYTSGALPCADATLALRKAQIETIRHPVILTPGDNDWSDCHRAVPKGFDPAERLAKLREMFFQGDESLGQRRLRLLRPSADPRYAKFRENARWDHGGVLFITLHMVGDNNNRGRTPEQDAEYAERMAANLEWMKQGFELAARGGYKAVMIVTQANPYLEETWNAAFKRRMRIGPPFATPFGFADFLSALEQEISLFERPVALVHGDTHFFRVDKPLRFAQDPRAYENFIRVDTCGLRYVR